MRILVYSFQTIVLLLVPVCWVVALQNPTTLPAIFAMLATGAAGGSAGALNALRDDLRRAPRAWTTILAWTALGCATSIAIVMISASQQDESRLMFLCTTASGLATFALFCLLAYAAQMFFTGDSPDRLSGRMAIAMLTATSTSEAVISELCPYRKGQAPPTADALSNRDDPFRGDKRGHDASSVGPQAMC